MKKPSLKEQVGIAITATVIGGVILSMLGFFPTLLHAAWDATVDGFSVTQVWLGSDFTIPIWLLLLLLTATGVLGVLIISNVWGRFRSEKDDADPWLRYTADVFFGAKYEWRWGWRDDMADIENLRAHCPKCDYSMVTSYDYRRESTRLICDDCNYRGESSSGSEKDLEFRVRNKIERRCREICDIANENSLPD